MRCPQFALCTALLLAWPPGGLWAADASPLFSSHKEAVEPRSPSQSLLGGAPDRAGELAVDAFASQGASRAASVVRSRVAEVNFGRLATAHSEVSLGRSHRLGLNLFSSGEFDAVLERSALTASGYTLTGRLADQPLSTVVLAVNGEWVAGDVWGPDGRYAIRPLGGGVTEVRQMDPAALGRCGVGMDASEGAEDLSPPEIDGPTRSPSLGRPALSRSAPMSETLPEDDGGVIDLLVVYPSFARRSAGGHRAMRALIDSDVAMANEAYRVGGAMQRLNLVAAVEARRTPLESKREGVIYARRHLGNPSSGYLDEAHALREGYASDLVLVHFGDGLLRSRVQGIAAGLYSLSAEDDGERGFSVSNSFAFTHELGHNMGLRHARRNSSFKLNLPFPYSYGYIHEFDPPLGQLHYFATIMAVGTARQIPRFSNPRQRYPDESGAPMGVPGDDPTQSDDGPADAVRSLNGTRRVVANFRRSASRCGYELSPSPKELPAAGGEFRIGVRAGAGCAWRAWSNDGFVSVLDGASGVGDGEVVVRVSANEGWEREVAVFVAGEAHLAEQATAKARRETPACNRAGPVRDALAEATGKPCGEIGAEDLASIRTLDLAYRHTFSHLLETEDRRLEPGDFDGLTGLVSLVLSDTNLAELAPGAFDGLVRLVSLDLSYSDLTELAAGVFDGLPNLVSLKLKNNPRLTTLEPGAFRGLSNVEELDFRGTGLTALSAGVFEGLSNLFRLDFGVQFADCEIGGGCIPVQVPLARVEPGAFRGLSNLNKLVFQYNSLKELRPGVFDGLPNLRSLVLVDNAGLKKLRPGVFDGLPNLRYLILSGNGLTTLPPGLLSGLVELEGLQLSDNRLKLEPGMFHNLAALRQLDLGENQLQRLEPGVFDGLARLRSLWLSGNRIRALDPGTFAILSRLEVLYLDDNGLSELNPEALDGLDALQVLSLAGNELRMLPEVLFNRLGALEVLFLGGNGLAALSPTLFHGLSSLDSLYLQANSLTSLPPRLLEGVGALFRLGLADNPGAPFAFVPELVRLPDSGSSPGGALAVTAEVAQGAPFDMRVPLSVSGGSPSALEVLIPRGAVRGAPVSIAPLGDGPVTVATMAPSLPSPCRIWGSPTYLRPCLSGLKTAAGTPLILRGLPDQALGMDGTVKFDLPTAFPNFPAGTTYGVDLGTPAVAEATVEKGLLTIASAGAGVTTVTVTATAPDARNATFTFTVKVERDINSYWSGWRSVLLKSPSSVESDGS